MTGKYTKLLIDGVECEIVEKGGFPIAVTRNIEPLEDVSSIQGSYIRSTINIRADQNSETVFKNIGSKDPTNSAALQDKEIVIIANGIPFFKGVCNLTEAQLLSDKYSKATSEYTIQAVGENADWFSKLKNITIGDLNLVPVHQLIDTYIETQFSNTAQNSNICYSAIYTKGFDLIDRIQYYEFALSIFVKAIVREAFKSVGLKLVSNFFNTDFGNRLIMPTFWSYTGVAGCEFRASEFRVPTPTPTTTAFYPYQMSTSGIRLDSCKGGKIAGPVANGTATTYTIKENDAYEILYTDAIKFGLPTPLVFTRLLVNDVIVTPQFVKQEPNYIVKRICLPLKKGDVIHLEYNCGSGGIQVPDNEIALIVTQQTILQKGNIIANDCLFYNKKHLLSDFILGVTQAFGLVVQTDSNEGIVTIEPRDNYEINEIVTNGYYNDLNHNYIAPKRSMKESASVSFGKKNAENFIKTWASDSNDLNLKAADDKVEIPLYGIKAEYTNETKFKVIENTFFSKTMMGLLADLQAHNSFTEINLPILNKEKGLVIKNNQTAFDFEPRILYTVGQRPFEDGEIKVRRDNLQLTSIKTPQSYFYNPKTADDYSLSYDNQKLIDNTKVTGLFKIFFLQHFARLRFGKILNDKFDFTLIDYLNFKFSQKWSFDGNVFIVQKMESFNFIKNEPTKFVLLADRYATQDDLNQIKNSNLIGYLDV